MSNGCAGCERACVLMMGVLGFFIAGPDGVLGGAAARNLADYNGAASRAAATISGLVNGMGSLGAILQGFLAPKLIDLIGWHGLFSVLGLCLVVAAATLVPAVALERRVLSPAPRA